MMMLLAMAVYKTLCVHSSAQSFDIFARTGDTINHHFKAVVFGGVMACGYHHPARYLVHRFNDEIHQRSRHGSDIKHVTAGT